MKDPAVDDAYNYCMQITRAHYENFPVASRLISRDLRKPISVIYAFARTADDMADEGNDEADVRLANLDDYISKLDAISNGEPVDHPVFIALQDTLRKSRLPLTPFYDLLTAFRMDVTKKRYANFTEVLNYCRFSANPVGNLVLHLLNKASRENLARSDAICTALQLINFLQDIEQDYVECGRIYLPQDEMALCNVYEEFIEQRQTNSAVLSLIDMQVIRILDLMNQGIPLGWELSGRIGYELRATIYGGLRVLDHLHQQRNDIYTRPRLGKRDWCWIAWMALQKHSRPLTLRKQDCLS